MMPVTIGRTHYFPAFIPTQKIADRHMTKKIIFSILGVLVIIGILGGIKGLQINRMIAIGSQSAPPPRRPSCAQRKPRLPLRSWNSNARANC